MSHEFKWRAVKQKNNQKLGGYLNSNYLDAGFL